MKLQALDKDKQLMSFRYTPRLSLIYLQPLTITGMASVYMSKDTTNRYDLKLIIVTFITIVFRY